MNWIWIILLLCCCKGNSNDCVMTRREERCESRCDSRRERDYPRAPFAPECERERERDCGCRASEIAQNICEE